MRIGVIIGRIGGVDGVALETEKWIEVLKQLGHEVFIASGEYEDWELDPAHNFYLHTLSFFSAECVQEQNKAFHEPDNDPDALLEHIEMVSDQIEEKLTEWVRSRKIDVLLSENASALPSHLSMGLAIKKLVMNTGLPVVSHNHDFHWERGNRYTSPHAQINEFTNNTFPLILPGVRQVVINTFGVEVFKDRFDIDATLVPNVMDFDQPFGIPTEKNRFFLQNLGVADDEIPLLQVTRIVRRKGIETAISLLDKLNDKKVKLLVTGNYYDDTNQTYYNELVQQTKDLNLTKQVLFLSEHLKHPKYLSDVYARGRACTYFSTYEGFGNAFIEAVLARKPIFVNNYKPVYMQDIGNKGFETVMLEDNDLTEEAVKKMTDIIYNPERCKEIGDFNYELGKKFFSYDVLREKLSTLFSF